MQPIQLTEEHKSKLLEMCKELFPEYKNDISKNEAENIQILHNNFIRFYSGYKENNPKLNEIHWFEFCMIYLQNQILVKASQLNKSDDLGYDFFRKLINSWYTSHPINYLYEQFLKLKKNGKEI